MPLEPKRKIEELLKAYATRRREQSGSPLELTPVTRALLQGEVARKFPASAQPRSRWQWITGLWPRLILAGGLAAVLTLAVFWPSRTQIRQERLAKAVQPATPAAPEPTSAEKWFFDETPKVAREQTDGVRTTATPPLARDRESSNFPVVLFDDDSVNRSEKKVPDRRVAQLPIGDRTMAANASPRMPLVSEDKEKLKLAETVPSSAGPAANIKFQQNASVNDLGISKTESSPQVLTSFSVERYGSYVRVVDQDGSVYQGQVTNAPAEKAQQVVKGQVGTLENQDFDFRVSGTNNRLRQNVLFTGSMTQRGVASQSGISTYYSGGGMGGGSGGRGGPSTSQLSPQNQISGQVQIGPEPTNTFTINAEESK